MDTFALFVCILHTVLIIPNGSVIFLVSRHAPLRGKAKNIFVCGMAGSNLFFLIMVTITMPGVDSYVLRDFNMTFRIGLSMTLFLCNFIYICMVLLVSFEQFMAIAYPMWHHIHIKNRPTRVFRLMVIAWLISTCAFIAMCIGCYNNNNTLTSGKTQMGLNTSFNYAETSTLFGTDTNNIELCDGSFDNLNATTINIIVIGDSSTFKLTEDNNILETSACVKDNNTLVDNISAFMKANSSFLEEIGAFMESNSTFEDERSTFMEDELFGDEMNMNNTYECSTNAPSNLTTQKFIECAGGSFCDVVKYFDLRMIAKCFITIETITIVFQTTVIIYILVKVQKVKSAEITKSKSVSTLASSNKLTTRFKKELKAAIIFSLILISYVATSLPKHVLYIMVGLKPEPPIPIAPLLMMRFIKLVVMDPVFFIIQCPDLKNVALARICSCRK